MAAVRDGDPLAFKNTWSHQLDWDTQSPVKSVMQTPEFIHRMASPLLDLTLQICGDDTQTLIAQKAIISIAMSYQSKCKSLLKLLVHNNAHEARKVGLDGPILN